MIITKNSLDESIIYITELEKRVVVYVKKDGLTLFDFRFDSLTNYDGNITFRLNSMSCINLFQNSFLIKNKLKYEHQSDIAKFYTLEI